MGKTTERESNVEAACAEGQKRSAVITGEQNFSCGVLGNRKFNSSTFADSHFRTSSVVNEISKYSSMYIYSMNVDRKSFTNDQFSCAFGTSTLVRTQIYTEWFAGYMPHPYRNARANECLALLTA